VAKGCLPAITLLLIEFRKMVVVKIIGDANRTLIEALITSPALKLLHMGINTYLLGLSQGVPTRRRTRPCTPPFIP
jgi:hypothetical protein